MYKILLLHHQLHFAHYEEITNSGATDTNVGSMSATIYVASKQVLA
jgi:hypothetical protein